MITRFGIIILRLLKVYMNWIIAEAQQKFDELVHAAEQEPQLIYQQNQLVAAVIEAELFQEFLAWRKEQKKSLISAFQELRQIMAEENYDLEVPIRQDRDNPFMEKINDFSL